MAIWLWECMRSLFPSLFSTVLHSSRRELAPMAHWFPCKALVLSIWTETAESWGDTGFEQRRCTANVTVLRGFHTSNSCQVCHRVQGYGWQHLHLVHIICLSQLLSNVTTSLVWRREWKVRKYRFCCFPQGYYGLS